ncbi:MAG: hypothetical protein AAF560_03765 [Acidobacteriota bacterium]
MKHTLASFTALALMSGAASVQASAPAKPIELELPAKVRSASSLEDDGRPSFSKPSAGALPISVELPNPGIDEDLAGVDPSIETRAAVAATWTARKQFKNFGQRQLFQVGFHEALHWVLDDPVIGEWDYRRGQLAGEQAPDATRVGLERGRQDALQAARETATRHVSALFQAPGRRPLPDPRPAVPAALVAALNPEVRAPQLIDVFEAVPVAEVSTEAEALLASDPWMLYRRASSTDAYDDSWVDAKGALDFWLDHHRERALWRQLDTADRASFSRLFQQIYQHQLSELLAERAERVYAQGFDAGWTYGNAVAHEWSFRQGYHAGFAAQLTKSAQTGFEELYPEHYQEHYRSLYREHFDAARLAEEPGRTDRDRPGRGASDSTVAFSQDQSSVPATDPN